MLDKKSQKTLRRKIGTSVKLGTIAKWRHQLTNGPHVAKTKIKKWLASEGKKKVQVGGGRHVIAGWLNLDLIAGDVYHDATKRLPFPDNSIDLYFTEQFFEHLSYPDGHLFLEEVFRTLKPGGRIRQSTPSLEFLCATYAGKSSVPIEEILDRHFTNHTTQSPRKSAGFFNDMFRLWGHQFIYDKDTLEQQTLEIGFVNFSLQKFGKSDLAELCDLERHADRDWMKTDFSIVYEAEKPL